MRQKWIQVWTEELLEGSIRFDLTSAQRGIWIDLLAMAGRSRNFGVIQANPDTAYPHHWIANKLNISLDLLHPTLGLLKSQGRIIEDEKGIKIVNFSRYQQGAAKKASHDVDVKRVFETWNDCKVIVHQKLTAEMETAIVKVVKDNDMDVVISGIKCYAGILHNPAARFTWKWTLRDFLVRGLGKFIDRESAEQNYLTGGNPNGGTGENTHSRPAGRNYGYNQPT